MQALKRKNLQVSDRDLDLAEYDDLGGIHGAIAKEAEVVLEVARNQGVEDDFFPGPLGVSAFGSFTVPSSDGYLRPSGITLNSMKSL